MVFINLVVSIKLNHIGYFQLHTIEGCNYHELIIYQLESIDCYHLDSIAHYQCGNIDHYLPDSVDHCLFDSIDYYKKRLLIVIN